MLLGWQLSVAGNLHCGVDIKVLGFLAQAQETEDTRRRFAEFESSSEDMLVVGVTLKGIFTEFLQELGQD